MFNTNDAIWSIKKEKKYFKLEFIGWEMIASKTKTSHLFITSLSPYNQAQTRPFT